ncbi:MAG TPA: DNA gyrase subunit B, partial [Planctomycetaceae bacterium]|nr:DNA gyrase subunit B [Planctomycetaceae bacterium]
GKIINAYKAREDKVLANEEVRSMIAALGSGIGEEIDLAKRRYGKIVIMTDADVDGSHIRTLLLTFFYRQMYELVKAGHVYIACPPLYRVRRKGHKDRYIQSEEEMRKLVLDIGLKGAAFDPLDGRLIEGGEMEKLCRILTSLEESIVALERRGISLRDHAVRQDPISAKLPIYHVFYDKREHWFRDRAEMDAFLADIERESGREASITENGHENDHENGGGTGLSHFEEEPKLRIVELHEVRTMNRLLVELRNLGFEIDALLPQVRTGSDTARYYLRKGETRQGIDDLRDLLGTIHEGVRNQRAVHITRFKGLGEMEAEELRDTTLNMTSRTLIQVTMEDASAADDLFRILMGDKVEPRREFIEKYALDVKNLDV